VLVWGKGLKRRPLPHTPIPLYTLYRAGTKYRAGHFEELFEVWTWSQLGIHRKPLGMLNVAGYYDPLVALVEHGVEEGFLRQQHRDSLIVDTDPGRLLASLREFTPVFTAKWIERDQR
jgi:predicted Rossmann-fold nucleotide-binding protein